MAVYTTQVRTIIEQTTPNFAGTWSARIKAACPSIFNFDFPIFQESHRLDLETGILRHYFNKEIGLETVGLWKFYLETRLNEIMPYYNQLYAIEANTFDYLADVDLTDEYVGNTSGNENGTDNALENSTTKRDVSEDIDKTVSDSELTDTTQESHSGQASNSIQSDIVTRTQTTAQINTDFPQAKLSDIDYASSGANTSGTENDTDTLTLDSSQTINQNGSGKVDRSQDIQETHNRSMDDDTDYNSSVNKTITRNTTGWESNTRKTKGKSPGKTYTEMMVEYRNAIINIDKLIIMELADLFMTVY